MSNDIHDAEARALELFEEAYARYGEELSKLNSKEWLEEITKLIGPDHLKEVELPSSVLERLLEFQASTTEAPKDH